MKKFAFLFVLASVFFIDHAAQAQAQIALGIKGGLNFAQLDVENASLDNRTGYHAGAFLLFKLSKIGIQPEILFSKQGSELPSVSPGLDFKANFDYINIPVILKIYTIAGLNIQVGPQFGFLTTAEVEDAASNTLDVKDLYKTSDVSVALGLGWDLPFGLTVDARYNLGISDIDDDASLEPTKNQVIQVALGYKLIKFGK